MSGWRIQLLGNTMVQHGDQTPVMITDPHARALLAYLALDRQRPHRKRDLIALLWPEQPAINASLLQNTLDLVAEVLDSQGTHPMLDQSRFRVTLRVDNEKVVDVEQFRYALAVSERHPHESMATCTQCQRLLTDAAALYQGAFLEDMERPGTAFANWLIEQRNALREQALHVFRTLTDVDLTLGQFESAIIFARKQLLLDPWYTPAHQQLMTAFTETGEIDQALSHYEGLYPRYRATFKRPPDATLTAQYDRLRSKQVETPAQTDVSACLEDDAQGIVDVPAMPMINVGREVETAQVASWLTDPNVRAVIISGPGGIGKTQLALKALQAVRGSFADGIVYIPLLEFGSCSVPELDALVQQRIRGPVEVSTTAPRSRNILVILDNTEAVSDTMGTWLTNLLESINQLKVMICTQLPMDLPYRTLSLSYLSVPAHEDNSGIQSYASMRMFEAYAKAVNPTFELNSSNIPAVVSICRAVAGLPLGIQLAAMWVGQFTPVQLASAIKHDMDVIISPNETIPQRHRSLRALFTQMLHVLSEAERSVLLQSAIFTGSFDQNAAQHIIEGPHVVQSIEKLLKRGVLLQNSENRFTLVATVAPYAREFLISPDMWEPIEGFSLPDSVHTTAQRHSLYFQTLLKQHIDQWNEGNVHLQAIEPDIDNIHAAWRRLERHTRESFSYEHLESWLAYLSFSGDTKLGIEVCDKLSWYLKHNLPAPDSDPAFVAARQRMITRLDVAHIGFLLDAGRFMELGEVLARTVQQVPEANDTRLQVTFYHTWGQLFIVRGEYTAAQEQLSQAWRMLLELSSPELAAINLLMQGQAALDQNQEEVALTYFDQGFDMANTAHWRWLLCEAHLAFAKWHMIMGDYGQAQSSAESAWQLARELGTNWLIPRIQLQFGLLAHRLGNLDDARSWLEVALALSREYGHRIVEFQILTALADLFLEQHDLETALATAQQAIEPAHSIGLLAEEANAMLVAARVLEAKHQYDFALAAYLKVQPIFADLGKHDEMPVVHAGIARCEAQRGNLERAHRHAERIVHRLRNKGRLLAFHEPMHIYSTCYDILVGDNAPRAVTVLRTGHEDLQNQVKSIQEPIARATFLNKVAANRGIINRLQLYQRQRRVNSKLTHP